MKKKKRVLIFLLSLFLIIILFYASSKPFFTQYVKNHHIELEALANELISSKNEDFETHYLWWRVYFYKNANMVEFATVGFGLGPASGPETIFNL